MTGEPVVTPTTNEPITVLVDWLELIAFFNEFGIARLDVLQGALKEQEEEPEDNIGLKDQAIENQIELIENEINERENACNGGYPFHLSDDAEELSLKDKWDDKKYSVYIVCLLASHLTNSLFDFEVDNRIVQCLRKRVFQVISTIAMAGLAGGSAVSVGWPRAEKQTVLQTLKRAEDWGAGFTTREQVGKYVPPQEKDGGIDVISWSSEDRPPPTMFYYAQVASGANWKGKPVKVHIDVFEPNYFEYPPRGNKAFATLIPFRETDVKLWISEHTKHGTILDRTRLPRYAKLGLDLKNAGTNMDEADNMPQVTKWITDFRVHALAAA